MAVREPLGLETHVVDRSFRPDRVQALCLEGQPVHGGMDGGDVVAKAGLLGARSQRGKEFGQAVDGNDLRLEILGKNHG